MICSRCGADKPEGEFYADKHAKSGRRSECKECKRAMTRARRRQPGYRERNREYQRKWAAENADAIRERKRAWYRANADRVKAQQVEYRRRSACA